MTVTLAGADGCRGGWVCVLRQLNAPYEERVFIAKTIQEILSHPSNPAVIAIDIPIGLPDRVTGAGRACDIAARAVLGKRAAAVFAVPPRSAIAENEYRKACEAALANSDPPRQISQQMFWLFGKVREADCIMTPALQNRVYECHPEVAFWAMNERIPLAEPKKSRGRPHAPGLDQRRTLLLRHGFGADFINGTSLRASEAGPDDFLDACACAWTATRIFKGEALRYPEPPPLDCKGLRMEILA